MSRFSAEILFSAGRAVFQAKEKHRKSTSHLFLPAGRFFDSEKFTERVLRTTWDGRWSAIDCGCEALFVDFFRTLFCGPPSAKKQARKARRSSSDSFRRSPRHFFNNFQETRKFAFSYILNMEKFFVMGETFFCVSFSETKSGKRANYFDPMVFHESCLKRHSTLRQGSILSRGTR